MVVAVVMVHTGRDHPWQPCGCVSPDERLYNIPRSPSQAALHHLLKGSVVGSSGSAIAAAAAASIPPPLADARDAFFRIWTIKWKRRR